jgi:hypothetical protein
MLGKKVVPASWKGHGTAFYLLVVVLQRRCRLYLSHSPLISRAEESKSCYELKMGNQNPTSIELHRFFVLQIIWCWNETKFRWCKYMGERERESKAEYSHRFTVCGCKTYNPTSTGRGVIWTREHFKIPIHVSFSQDTVPYRKMTRTEALSSLLVVCIIS